MGAWYLLLAVVGVVGVGGMSVEEVARARSLDTVIVELLRGYLRLHQQEQHLQEHYKGSYLANHLARVTRYIEEYDNLLAGRGSRHQAGRGDAAGRRTIEEDGADPLLGYLVTRRLVRDWHSLRDAPLGDSWQELVGAAGAAEVALGLAARPHHHVGQAGSLLRLHHVYGLDALHVARGRLHPRHARATPLRVSDVAGVGVAALEDGMYGRAAEWFMAAHRAAHDHKEIRPDTNSIPEARTGQQLDILLHLATAAHDYKLSKEGFANQAGIYPRPLAQVPLGEQQGSPDPQQEKQGSPDPQQEEQGSPYSQQEEQGSPDPQQEEQGSPDPQQEEQGSPDPQQEEQGSPDPQQEEQGSPDPQQEQQGSPDPQQEEQGSPDPQQEQEVGPDLTPTSIPATPRDAIVYSRLCRGHRFLSAWTASRLKCRVDRRGSAWLTLMPALVEEHSLHPPIISFHHVLSDRQLDVFRHLALPLVEQARVQIRDEGAQGSPVLKHRSSYTAWLPARAHPALRAASRMVAALTGLEVSEELGEAEVLQVNQYGIGGHYDPHMDFLALYRRIWEAEEPELKLLEQHPNGDRIATFMFYMNDVEEGGRTVFPRVGVGVEPRRGSAVFWWNLLPSGRGDPRLLHAACPVLRGTKWVSNKWIKSHPQLHHRPCLPVA